MHAIKEERITWLNSEPGADPAEPRLTILQAVREWIGAMWLMVATILDAREID